MECRRLGKTDWQVTAVSLGCWGIGGQWGLVADDTAAATLHRALDLGINFFDTADAYGEPQGRSETLMGRTFLGVRDRIFIATKVGNWGRRMGHPLPYTHPGHIIGCLHASLYRLRTDYVDLLQCHVENPADADVFLDAFETLIEEGKIRAYGLSTGTLAGLEKMNARAACATVQLDYSLLNRRPEAELLPYCQAHDVGVIARGSLAQGLLTGKFSSDTVFTDWVRQKWNAGGAGHEQFLKGLAVAETIGFLVVPGRSLAQAALQFVLAHPAVSCTIPGATRPAQVEMNSAAFGVPLTEEELVRVRALT